jgi:hypothetical protein
VKAMHCTVWRCLCNGGSATPRGKSDCRDGSLSLWRLCDYCQVVQHSGKKSRRA